eukprot:gene10743-11893_t
MEISEEEGNFVRVGKLCHNDISIHLRTFFEDKWDSKYPTNCWDNTEAGSGQTLFQMMKNDPKVKQNCTMKSHIKAGNCNNWDITTLSCVILSAALKLNLSHYERNQIEILRNIRNTRLGHLSEMKISNDDRKIIFNDVRQVYQTLNWPESELNAIEVDPITTEDMKELRAQVDRERKEAIKDISKDFHNLPEDIGNYIGRKEEMDNLLDAVEHKEGHQVILIHGGPCYGKSAFATKFGHEMVEKGCNYVIWTDMRSIVHDSNVPNVESLAMRILDEFDIDVDDCKEKAQKYLEMKCKSIRKNNKQLLIILDNADSMLGIDENSNDTTEAYKMIKGLTSDCVKVALTSRSSRLMDVQKVQIKPFTKSEGKMYLESTLVKDALMDRDDLVERLNACSHGMPLALKILVNAVNNAEDSQYLQDYLNDVENKTITTLDEEHPIMHLFEISFKYLQNEELELIKMLAVYPSAFSYRYVQKLSNQLNINARKSLNAVKKRSLLEVNTDSYYFHPLFLEYIKKTKWVGKDEEKFQKLFIEVYVTAIFDLGVKSLKKDTFSENLEEAKVEKSNFLYVMDLVRKERTSGLNGNTFNKTANEHVAMILFMHGFIYDPILIDFLKTCESLASDESKYYAQCCHYELCTKIFNNEHIQEPNEQEVLDDEGKRCCVLLLKRRQFSYEVHSKEFERRTDEDISKDLERLLDEAKQLSDSNQQVTSSLNVFGKHPFTFDCHVQIAKCYWTFQLFEKANECFESAKCFAESMNMQDVQQYANYLLAHGRCLIDSKMKENEQQGVALLEQSLETCDDTHRIFFVSAITRLMRVDVTYYKRKLLPYFYDLEDPSGNICNSLTGCVMFSEDISELLRASSFLGKILEKNKVWSKKCFKQMKALLEWNNMIFDHPDVSNYSIKAEANKDRVIYLAKEALKKFIIEMNAAYCENDGDNIERSSTKAVNEMQEAITHLEHITKGIDGRRRSFCIQSLYLWNKLIAETMLAKDREQFAKEALDYMEQGAVEPYANKIENLKKIQNHTTLMVPADKLLETLKARKVLLKMISKIKIPKNQRDNLEKDYWRLLGDSMKSTNLNVKVNIIKDAFEVADMSIQTYPRYLEVLLQLLSSAENGVCGWQYKVFIKYLPKLLSFDGFDQTHLHPGVKIGRKFLTHLNDNNRRHFKNERMVQFEIRYIMAIYLQKEDLMSVKE